MSSKKCLTVRELEVLQLVARGLTDTQVAEQLQLSCKTVHNHVAFIRAKMGAKTRGEAIALALHKGIITGDESSDGSKT